MDGMAKRNPIFTGSQGRVAFFVGALHEAPLTPFMFICFSVGANIVPVYFLSISHLFTHDTAFLEIFYVEAVPDPRELLSCSCKKVGKEHGRGGPLWAPRQKGTGYNDKMS